MHDDSSIGTFDLNADVSGELGSCRFCGCTQGERHKRLWPIDQCALAMFAQPAVYDVGVDAVLQCHPGDGCSGLSAGCDNLNTHTKGALYTTFSPEEGMRPANTY